MTRFARATGLIAVLATWAGAVQGAGDEDGIAKLLLGAKQVEQKAFGVLDLEALAVEDALTDDLPGWPQRFAVPRKVDWTPASVGTWTRTSDDEWTWRLRVRGKGAAHLNFGFRRFALPPGAELHLVSTDGRSKLGPYTAADMLPHGQLWTPVVLGEEALLHLAVPADRVDAVTLELMQVNQGYRGFGVKSKVCKSGSCNTDVACLAPDDPWNENRRAVGAVSNGGSAFCTGSLLNNTANDRRMLFATATHCGVNDDQAAASVVVYWNYEFATCRVPGSAASGAPPGPEPSTTSAGVRFLAGTNNPFGGGGDADSRSDWSLLELAEPPVDNDFDLFWAGWDRREPPTTCAAPLDPSSTAGLCASIHHPRGDEKRITFVEVPMTRDDISFAENVHWLANWDPTPPELAGIDPLPNTLPPSVTEPGSSGSPLYDASRRLVGVLSGGASVCGVNAAGLNDQYGGLFHAWEGLGTPETRMRDHLDPSGSGVLFIDGIGACDPPAPPENLTAMASGDNEISLAWDAVTGADRYRVFRSTGTCPGTGYEQIAEVSGTSFIDDGVSGGTDYVYRVASVSDDGPCVSGQGSCAGATATGTCAAPPIFDGLASAMSAGTNTCGINLGWTAASSSCGSDDDLRYSVYRSTEDDFTPGPANRILTCQADTGLLDEDVTPGTTFFYVVRAEDLAAQPVNGQCGGVEETNLLRREAAAFGPETTRFEDDVESGTAPWLVSGTGAGADFAIVTDVSSSPVSSWFVSDPDDISDRRLTLAEPVALPVGTNATFRFANRYETETGFDGAVLEYSIDGGNTWQDILAGAGGVPADAARILSNGYVGTISSDFESPIGGREAWTGSSGGAFVTTEVNLADFGGQELLLSFRFASDLSIGDIGWWLDDFVISEGTACEVSDSDRVFADGFEPLAEVPVRFR